MNNLLNITWYNPIIIELSKITYIKIKFVKIVMCCNNIIMPLSDGLLSYLLLFYCWFCLLNLYDFYDNITPKLVYSYWYVKNKNYGSDAQSSMQNLSPGFQETMALVLWAHMTASWILRVTAKSLGSTEVEVGGCPPARPYWLSQTSYFQKFQQLYPWSGADEHVSKCHRLI